jgi:hypothetical protein
MLTTTRELNQLRELRQNRQRQIADLMVKINQYQDMVDNLAETEYKYENCYYPFVLLKEAYQYLLKDCRRQLKELEIEAS